MDDGRVSKEVLLEKENPAEDGLRTNFVFLSERSE